MRKTSLTREILLALVPYTRQNLLLTFKPSQFFYELERKTGSSRSVLQSTFSRAQRQGYIKRDIKGAPRLTEKGFIAVNPARPLEHAWLIVIFDIPEANRRERDQLRYFLRVRDFRQIQRSIWATQFDHRQELLGYIKELGIETSVNMLQCDKIELIT